MRLCTLNANKIKNHSIVTKFKGHYNKIFRRAKPSHGAGKWRAGVYPSARNESQSGRTSPAG
jgi:hypothetical protein